jgi:hypothetical protein
LPKNPARTGLSFAEFTNSGDPINGFRRLQRRTSGDRGNDHESVDDDDKGENNEREIPADQAGEGEAGEDEAGGNQPGETTVTDRVLLIELVGVVLLHLF